MERRESVNAIKQVAYDAGRGISMDPERYGESLMDHLECELQQFLSKIPEEIRSEYEGRYIEKYKEWLYAMSRCLSVMIAGAGNFNVRRHEKTNRAEENARQRLSEWAEKVIKRVNHQQRLIGWDEVERLQNKHDKLVETQELMKAANKIIKAKKMPEVEKWDELSALGISEKNINMLLTPDYMGRTGFQTYQLSNNLAEIKRLEGQIKIKSTNLNKVDAIHQYEWGTIEYCYSEERVRFCFDDMPSKDVIQIMKSNAFKWSPRNSAWQRQITPNALFAVKNYIIPELGKHLSIEEIKE